MLKNIILITLILTFCYKFSLSQDKRQMDGFEGEITGKIVDNASGKPMEYANISIFSLRDSSLVGGAITDAKGFFKVEKLKPGFYKVKVDFIGYERYINTAKVNPQNPSANIGTIKLKPATTQLSEVEVISEKPMVEFTLDKKIINVEKNIITAGGSATDILRTTPSVSVDMDGIVSLRGSTNVTILIDGKPSMLSGGDKAAILEQIPASTIESIELITNPSAKYDPEGMAGIINIKTKKEKRNGTNGLITLNYGTWEKYGASVNLNRRTGKFNVYANYDYRNNDRNGYRKMYREYYNDDTLVSIINVLSDRKSSSLSHTFKGGLDYNLSPMTTINASGTYRMGGHQGSDYNTDLIYDNLYDLTQSYTRDEISNEDNNNTDLTLGFKKKFELKDRELTADAYYSLSNENESNKYIQNNILPDTITPEQKSIDDSKFKNFTFQSDYTEPINEKTKLDAGLKYMLRSTDDDYKFSNYDTISSDFYNDTNLSNHFVYTDQVYAAYTTISKEWKKFSIQAGLRAEQTEQNGNQETMDSIYKNDYFSFFPSFHTSYNLPKDNKLQISYSRRINRPSIRSMNPFIDASDPLTMHTGNPYLKPEYINSYEVGHIKDWKKFSLTSSLFFKQTNDVISRYRLVDSIGAMTVMPINVAKAQSYGFDFIISYQPVKFIRLSGDFSWFKTTLSGSNLETDLTSSIFSYNGRFNASVFLPKSFSLQVNFRLVGPSVMAQAIRKEFYTVDAGLKKDFKNKKISLSLRFSDIFNTMRFRVVTNDPTLKAQIEFKRQSQVAYITLSYRINEGNKQKEKNKNIDMNGGGEMDMGEWFFFKFQIPSSL